MGLELTKKAINNGNTRLFVCSCVSAGVLAIAILALPLNFRLLTITTGEIDTAQPLQVRIERKILDSSYAPQDEAALKAEQPSVDTGSKRENEPVITASRDTPSEIRTPVQEVQTTEEPKPARDWDLLLLASAAKTIASSADTSYVTFDGPRREASAVSHSPAARHSIGSETGLELPGQLGFAECPPNASFHDSMRDKCLRMCTPWPKKKRLFALSGLSD